MLINVSGYLKYIFTLKNTVYLENFICIITCIQGKQQYEWFTFNFSSITASVCVNDLTSVICVQDNVILMKEINDLRQELRAVRMQLHNYESQSSFNKNNKSSANSRGDR